MVIRINSLKNDLYLNRQGKWGTYQQAARFSSVSALEKFAIKHGVDVYGIFP